MMLSTKNPRQTQRADRFATARDVEVAVIGAGEDDAAVLMQAVLVDVSPTGFKATVEDAVPIGAFVELRVGGLDGLPATTMWQRDTLLGCRFETRLTRRALLVLSRSGLFGDTASPSA